MKMIHEYYELSSATHQLSKAKQEDVFSLKIHQIVYIFVHVYISKEKKVVNWPVFEGKILNII